jgi:hypothetical protein
MFTAPRKLHQVATSTSHARHVADRGQPRDLRVPTSMKTFLERGAH